MKINIGSIVQLPQGKAVVVDKEKNVLQQKNPILRWIAKLKSVEKEYEVFYKTGDRICFSQHDLIIKEERLK